MQATVANNACVVRHNNIFEHVMRANSDLDVSNHIATPKVCSGIKG